MPEVPWREPLSIAQGDTLTFNRRLSAYPASAGWYLDYVLRGGAQAIEFKSTPINTDAHSITVAAAITSTWLPGDYTLAGYAVSGDGTQRFQIYDGDLAIAPDLQGSQGDIAIKTFAQQMVENLESIMLGSASSDLLQSRIGETQFQYLTPEQLRSEHGYWKTVRRHEIAMERARQGRPTGTKVRPVMSVITVGPNRGLFGRGSTYLGW